jgi:hypothetical protein
MLETYILAKDNICRSEHRKACMGGDAEMEMNSEAIQQN